MTANDEALRESEKRYRVLVENLPAFLLILSRAGEILFINQAEVGYSLDDVIGSDAFAYLLPESRALQRENLRRVFEEDLVLDYDIVTILDTHYRCRVVLLDPERALVISIDITERKQAEQALEESQKLLSAIVENIPDMVFVKDAEHLRFVRFNKAAERLLGYSRQDLLGKSDHDVFPKDEAEFFVAKDREVLAGGGVLDIPEETIETRDKGKRLLRTKKVPILSESGEPQYLLGISEDITERRSLETQVQQAQKLESLGLLAGGIAHDFNNLLSSILMNADLARQALPPGSPSAANLDNVLKSTHQAAALAGQMLAYAGKGDFSFRRLDLNSVVSETRSLIQTSISKKADLSLELAEALPAIEADPSQVQQVVMNLVINASEALADETGAITIRTSCETRDRARLSRFELDNPLEPGRYVSLAVSDSGSGMTPETRAKVFDPFFSTKFAGRGLGLAAILGIVRGHKGGIQVESEPGQGTTFTVLFPAVDGPAPAPPGAATANRWRGSGTVLLVDDEEFVRVAASLALKHLGFTVLVARDGREAIEVFREHQAEVRCVLLDLKMPHMDGEETLPELRRISAKTPVILSSGYTERDSTKQFAGLGLAGFLQKPYALDELREKLRATLDG